MAISPLPLRNGPELWRSYYPVLKPDGHKYDRGAALVYGGAEMTGAARLATRAAQRMGAGLVTVATSTPSVRIYAEALESAIVRATDTLAEWQKNLDDPKVTAVLIGPGLGQGELQKSFVLAALATEKPCVLDADALTNFAATPEVLFSKLHAHCVLTPHEGEFARLFGTRIKADAAKTDRALQAAQIAKCIVLLKGAETVIASPDGQTLINTNAPPWLATAGAGDVLAGLILGLLAQKMPIFWAAAAATWLHGDIATRFGQGLIAEDLVDGVPRAVQNLLDAD